MITNPCRVQVLSIGLLDEIGEEVFGFFLFSQLS